jgi:hypothetical protein
MHAMTLEAENIRRADEAEKYTMHVAESGAEAGDTQDKPKSATINYM